jgi:hypothetical protein
MYLYTSQEILNRPVFMLDILNITEHSEQILNITENSEHSEHGLNRFWTLLKILNVDLTDSEHYWKFWRDSEHSELIN